MKSKPKIKQPLNPTPSLVAKYVNAFEQDSGYRIVDSAVLELFNAMPLNQRLEDVLVKVAVLNSLYKTNIYAVYQVAEHIVNLDIDPALERHSLNLVQEISVVTVGGKRRRNYSFASKYCSKHIPRAYPMYDSYVESLLWAYRKTSGFATFRRKDLQQYPLYVEAIMAFMDHYGLSQFSFRDIDKFLWLYGREYTASSLGW